MTMKTTLQLAGTLIAAALLAPAAHGATIYGHLTDAGYSAIATNITFRPISAPLEVNQSLYVRADVTNVTDSAGGFTNALVAGDYQMFIGSNPRNTLVIGVPNDNGVYNFTTLIETSLTYPYSSPPAARTTASGLTDVTLGTNLAHGDVWQYNTNHGRWTNAPASGGGSGSQTPLTNNVAGAYYSLNQLEGVHIDGRSDGSGGTLTVSGGNPTVLGLRNGTDGSTNHGWNITPYSLAESAPWVSNSLQLLTVSQNEGWQIASNGTLRIVGGGTLGTVANRISNGFFNALNLSNGSGFTTAGNALLHDANGNVYSGTVAGSDAVLSNGVVALSNKFVTDISGASNLIHGRALFARTNGVDSTGARNNEAFPYRTITHAVSNATAGDAVFIGPGTNWFANGFSTNIAKANTAIHLAPGTTLYATNHSPLFDHLNGAITNFSITGEGDIVWRMIDWQSVSNATAAQGSAVSLLAFTNAASSIHVDVRDLIAQPQETFGVANFTVVYNDEAPVSVRARDIIMESADTEASYILQWRGDGPMSVDARHLANAGNGLGGTRYGVVWADQTTNSHLYVNAQSLTADFPIYGQTIGSAGNEARIWVNIPNIVSTSNEVFWNTAAGLIYGIGEKVYTPTDMFRFSTAGRNYLWYQKAEAGKHSQGGGSFPLAANTNIIRFDEVVDEGNTSVGWLTSGTGQTDLWIGTYIANPTNNKAFTMLNQNSANHPFRVWSGLFDNRSATNRSAAPVLLASEGMSLGNVILLSATNRQRQATLILTNYPVAGDTIVLSGATRTWAATNGWDTIATNVLIGGCATNLKNHFTTNAVNSITVTQTSVTNLLFSPAFSSTPFDDATFVTSGTWATNSFVTNAPRHTITNSPAATVRNVNLIGVPRGNNPVSDNTRFTAERFAWFHTNNWIDGGTNWSMGLVLTNPGATTISLLNVGGVLTNSGGLAVAQGTLLTGGVTNNGTALFTSGVNITSGQRVQNDSAGNNYVNFGGTSLALSGGAGAYLNIGTGNNSTFGPTHTLTTSLGTYASSNATFGLATITNGVSLPVHAIPTNTTAFIIDCSATNNVFTMGTTGNLTIGLTNKTAGIARGYTLTLAPTNGDVTVTINPDARWPRGTPYIGTVTVTNYTRFRLRVEGEGNNTNDWYYSSAVF